MYDTEISKKRTARFDRKRDERSKGSGLQNSVPASLSPGSDIGVFLGGIKYRALKSASVPISSPYGRWNHSANFKLSVFIKKERTYG